MTRKEQALRAADQLARLACEANWPSVEYWNKGGEGYRLAYLLQWFGKVERVSRDN